VLGVLFIALVGTIFYRIVNPLPAKAIALEDLVLAPEINAASVPWAAQLPNVQRNTSFERDSNVSSATFADESAATGNPAAAPPKFIAPAER
jgi:hypothetical protein